MNAAKKDWITSNIGTLITIMCILFGAGGSWAVCQHQLNNVSADYHILKEQHGRDHDVLTELRNDVKWIRATIEAKDKTSSKVTKTNPAG